MKKIAMVFPYAPLYREPIYKLMDEEFDCTFFFCGNSTRNLKYMDYSHLKKVNTSLSEHFWRGLQFYDGISNIDLSGFDYIIHPGTIRNPSSWYLQLKYKLKKKSPKIFIWTHGWYGKESPMEILIKKIYFKLTDGILVYGNYAKKGLESIGVSSKKIEVIYNSLDYDVQLKLRKELTKSDLFQKHFNNSDKVLICICRLEMRKQLDLLIESIAKLKDSGDNYNVVIIGDGEDKERLKTLSARMGVEQNIWFYGSCYNEKINAELLYNADLCVVPGDVGLTAIHSMMFGTPLITHDYFKYQGPEFESVKDNITGMFFRHGNIESLTSTISQWFITHPDRESVRSACYKEIDTLWNPHAQINLLKRIFNK